MFQNTVSYFYLRETLTDMELFDNYRPNHFKVPVYKRVKKFLKEHQGIDVNKPIPVDEHSLLGKMVLAALRENRKERAKEYNDQYRDQQTDDITIALSTYMMSLSPRIGKLIRINIDVDMWLKESMLTHIEAQRITGIPEYTACRSFLEHYKLVDDYNLDAAYKHYQRVEVFK
jgi:hypothetical protein